jgi:hypothetical protein
MELVQLSEQQKARVLQVMFENVEEIKKLQSPLEFHAVASNWNWDTDSKHLNWIIHNPVCDKGTALSLYWRAGPKALYQYRTRNEVPKWFWAIYDFVKDVEGRYLSGFYQQQQIAFDPRNDEGTNWLKEYSEVKIKQQIPDQMKIAISGITIDRSFAS